MKLILLSTTLLHLSQSIVFYNDYKQNCSIRVSNSYCYIGPQYDSDGQYKTCSEPGTIAMTFDDSPDENTEATLDLLKEFGIKATFFVIGKNIDAYSNTVKRIISDGHILGVHTYNHFWINEMTQDELRQDLLLYEYTLIKNDIKTIPHYFRAPHGVIDHHDVLTDFNYTLFHWSFLNGDSTILDPDTILKGWYSHMGGINGNGINQTSLKLIVQQHEKMDATFLSLRSVLTYLTTTFSHLRFVTLYDCIGQKTVPYREPLIQISSTSNCSVMLSRNTYSYCYKPKDQISNSNKKCICENNTSKKIVHFLLYFIIIHTFIFLI